MDRCASFDAYRMSDALWSQFKKSAEVCNETEFTIVASMQ